jgi:hypothetical protein
MDEDLMKYRLDQEIETIGINKLTELGNRAIQLGLIAGHGYHRGQYEILRQGQIILLSPTEATSYLENLLQDLEG